MTTSPKSLNDHTPVPQLDLAAQYAAIGPEVRAAIDKVLSSQHFVLGREGAALEAEVAQLCGTHHGIAVASGTDALILALRVCGVKAGDDVLIPPFTFVATGSAVSALGANPVFADIRPDTYNIDPNELQRRLTPKTRAIIVVHLYGLSADMDPILAFAEANKLAVIEDNAQAIGATYKGRPTGSFGDASCISFYPTKNLGAYGDAGLSAITDKPTNIGVVNPAGIAAWMKFKPRSFASNFVILKNGKKPDRPTLRNIRACYQPCPA